MCARVFGGTDLGDAVEKELEGASVVPDGRHVIAGPAVPLAVPVGRTKTVNSRRFGSAPSPPKSRSTTVHERCVVATTSTKPRLGGHGKHEHHTHHTHHKKEAPSRSCGHGTQPSHVLGPLRAGGRRVVAVGVFEEAGRAVHPSHSVLRKGHSDPATPAGSRHSCQPTVKLHILPLVWIFLWGRGSTGSQGAAAGICVACPRSPQPWPRDGW